MSLAARTRPDRPIACSVLPLSTFSSCTMHVFYHKVLLLRNIHSLRQSPLSASHPCPEPGPGSSAGFLPIASLAQACPALCAAGAAFVQRRAAHTVSDLGLPLLSPTVFPSLLFSSPLQCLPFLIPLLPKNKDSSAPRKAARNPPQHWADRRWPMPAPVPAP